MIQHESAKDLQSLIDCIDKSLRALKVLGYERKKLTDIMLVNIILSKLDRDNRKQFEYTLKHTEVPRLDNLIQFLENRSTILQRIVARIQNPDTYV
ncbi:uncharacterized protein NPIL_271731 [Nephila pilipes]|uniref:Uncharacterized protein n=1 Tax=Nephila pilipes TaxID=299642 RepID=A0A8X6QY25_NEPPI|nr:uncharacterized protein NPIL_271731 [Nephila pilipes]